MNSDILNPRIAVIGAGAVGCLLAGLLARKGHTVTLVGREEQVEAIGSPGLVITGALGHFTVKVDAQTRLDFKPDLLFLTVKAHDVAATCRQIQPQVKEIPVVTMQNGISPDAEAASYFGEKWVVGCVVLFNARYLEAGKVHCGFSGHLLLEDKGSVNPEPLATIFSLLEQVFPCQKVSDFTAVRWNKLIINAMGNGIEAMSGLPLGQCSRHPVLGKAAVLILREGFQVLKGGGIPIQPLPGFPILRLRRLTRWPLGLASRLLRQKWTKKRVQEVVSSTLQSLMRGRTTEIDFINGEIVRLGSELGISTPVNAQVVEWVHQVEKNHTFIPLGDIEKALFKK